jgi:hypothetical protein
MWNATVIFELSKFFKLRDGNAQRILMLAQSLVATHSADGT